MSHFGSNSEIRLRLTSLRSDLSLDCIVYTAVHSAVHSRMYVLVSMHSISSLPFTHTFVAFPHNSRVLWLLVASTLASASNATSDGLVQSPENRCISVPKLQPWKKILD